MKKLLFLLGVFGKFVRSITSNILLFKILISALSHALPLEDQVWPIPQKDGSIKLMTEIQAKILAEITEPTFISDRKLDKVRYFLFTQSNHQISHEVEMGDLESLKTSHFNPDHETYFFVHGWGGGYWAGQNTKIRRALFENGENIQRNFFVVDWSVYGETSNYVYAKEKTSKAGKIVAEFLEWLRKNGGLSYDRLTLVGHSLGAHVVGFAGKNVQKAGHNVREVVGLDPAMPLFSYDKPDKRLNSGDAYYVETIQTNGGELGFYQPIGKAAFYPNGGRSQPGCGIDVSGGCAHERAVDYYAEALRNEKHNDFDVAKCKAFEDLKSFDCHIEARGIRMGDPDNIGRADGVYYLKTHKENPFAMGNVYVFQ